MRGLALPFFGVLMSFNKEDLLVNIKRQAKRLSKLLTIPLGQAQEGAAICLYGCDSYSDLLVKIKAESFDNPLIALSALSPNSEIFLVKILASHLDSIIGNFEKKFPGSNINEEMVVSLFGLSFSEFKLKIST
ncbi:hypothetical protein SAMN05216262_12416 [Colwellia chukchiensis]|uniref:Uncharacterized protein n=2 Tax=Gammaproteobacteria TaxID=1236 RepID=A0A1H7TC19_9GAMM|nr:hypothetical protein DFO83_11353 [Idiomarina loihiensis]TDP44224.1 hypothetical protein DET58_11253 [Idiomarina loihiensis]TDS20594.1 hypothetical protein DET62_1128 [Idiomarina sp. H2]SEL82341.1 hypothetical protein SAMN05216262_12416 [Colwellia chukchiensis]